MDAQQIKIFIDAMQASNLVEMQAEKNGWSLRLVRAAPGRTAVATTPAAATAVAAQQQCAALAGVVFLQAAPGQPVFVQPGRAVQAGEVLCVIEAMKIFNEVEAERSGIIDALLVESGQEVAAGQPLLRWR